MGVGTVTMKTLQPASAAGIGEGQATAPSARRRDLQRAILLPRQLSHPVRR
jgi:hypothetical protein